MSIEKILFLVVVFAGVGVLSLGIAIGILSVIPKTEPVVTVSLNEKSISLSGGAQYSKENTLFKRERRFLILGIGDSVSLDYVVSSHFSASRPIELYLSLPEAEDILIEWRIVLSNGDTQGGITPVVTLHLQESITVIVHVVLGYMGEEGVAIPVPQLRVIH